ncbi:MAG: hypothetical protein MI757_19685, partial [Pirellulales bacterium]|nr:hypothetical protein [Pirellulales bacterium]
VMVPPPMLMPQQPLRPSQVKFVGPDGMQVYWSVSGEDTFDSEPLVVPGRQNFPQNAIYRLKLTNVPERPGVELYPTLEVAPVMPQSEAFLDHSTIPVQLSEEDFDQVLAGNYVTKVIYIPDPEFQELAIADVETLVSTRLDPGVDPVVEADRRGTILAILRLGNKDIQAPGGEAMGGAGVIQASFVGPNGQVMGGPMMGGPVPGPPGMMTPPPGHVSGITMPQYGMPITGTPIGLPGPPHIPFGSPAGLKKHVMRNNTHHHLPAPTDKITMDLKRSPGYRYPKPPSRVSIHEKTHKLPAFFRQSHADQFQWMNYGENK